jgi:DNA-binding NarL/FixJ family response regulator
MNIVIIEKNKIFRESLKTALNQISGFKVVCDTENISYLQDFTNIDINLILIDYSFGKNRCNEIMNKIHSVWPEVRFLLLADYKQECNIHKDKSCDIILKNSSKEEFKIKIREQQL